MIQNKHEKWLGLIGGGQLGRMFCHAAQNMGFMVAVLDPDENSPAAQVANYQIKSDYTAESGLVELANLCKRITIEFENIPTGSLRFLENHTTLYPSSRCVEILQNRISEKAFITSHGINVANYVKILNKEEIREIDNKLFPGILKTAQFGYDGKGQVRVSNKEELSIAFDTLRLVPCVFESIMPIKYEISVVLARQHDAVEIFPVTRNIHVNGILSTSIICESNNQQYLEANNNAIKKAVCLAEALDYNGVMCVEFFVLENNSVIVNEIAPRPHNSGHYSINACMTSQFEQQVRVVANLPIGKASLLSQSVIMLNILGDIWFKKNSQDYFQIEPNWLELLKLPNVKLHLYGKNSPRPGRKMGHITCLGKNMQSTIDEVKRAAHILNIDFPKIY